MCNFELCLRNATNEIECSCGKSGQYHKKAIGKCSLMCRRFPAPYWTCPGRYRKVRKSNQYEISPRHSWTCINVKAETTFVRGLITNQQILQNNAELIQLIRELNVRILKKCNIAYSVTYPRATGINLKALIGYNRVFRP